MKKDDNNETFLIDSIKRSQERLIDKQNVYRDMLDEDPLDKSEAESIYTSINWEDFLEKLKDYYYPADEEALKKYLVTPSQFNQEQNLRIEAIDDLNIRCCVSMLDNINQHTQRIKVYAHLMVQFGALDFPNKITYHWIRYSQCETILKGISNQSELLKDDAGNSFLIVEATVSKLLLSFFLDIDLPDKDPSILENMPETPIQPTQQSFNDEICLIDN